MTTAFISHDDALNHVTPEGHPERVARLEAILELVASSPFDALQKIEAQLGTKEAVLLAHPEPYFQRIQSMPPEDGYTAVDADTFMSPGSFIAAMRGVGGICQAVDMVLDQDVNNAFIALRPPGHHAETETSMGFCFFGTVAIGAKYACRERGLSRVAIVDFDVHHGNGTQDLVWHDENILFVSSHQMPLYPGSGASTEQGAHNNVINIPLSAHSDGSSAIRHYKEQVLPALIEFEPELIFISAGFDAHTRDPLAQLNWQDEDFGTITDLLVDAAERVCDGRIVSTLEGGYDLEGLTGGLAAHLKVLMERGHG